MLYWKTLVENVGSGESETQTYIGKSKSKYGQLFKGISEEQGGCVLRTTLNVERNGPSRLVLK